MRCRDYHCSHFHMGWQVKNIVVALFCTNIPAPAVHMMGVTLPMLVKSGTCLKMGSWDFSRKGFLRTDLVCAGAFPDMTFWPWPTQFVVQTGPQLFIFPLSLAWFMLDTFQGSTALMPQCLSEAQQRAFMMALCGFFILYLKVASISNTFPAALGIFVMFTFNMVGWKLLKMAIKMSQ